MIRATVAFLGVLALAACTSLNAPTRSVSLGQSTVIATPPKGYCFDDVSSPTARDFVIVAPCSTLGAAAAARPDVIGFATVQVGPAESGSVAANELTLRDYLITDEGARLLSRTGDAKDIDILTTQAFNSQVMIHFTDAGPPPLEGLQQEEWRAFTNVNGRLVTVGVRGLAAAPLQEGSGASLLKLILTGVRAANTANEPPSTDA